MTDDTIPFSLLTPHSSPHIFVSHHIFGNNRRMKLNLDDNDELEIEQIVEEARHRRNVSQQIYSIWTKDGSDLSGIADKILLDYGKVIDLLGSYVTLQEYFEEEKDAYADDCHLKCSNNSTINHDNRYQIQNKKIDVIDGRNISYTEFYNEYMKANKPVILKELTNDWNCMKTLINPPFPSSSSSHNNNNVEYEPNFEAINKYFGENRVPVHIQSHKGFASSSMIRPRKVEMKVCEYIEWWKNHVEFTTQSTNNSVNGDNQDVELYYLKDWKFKCQNNNNSNSNNKIDGTKIYRCPVFFRDDWLNETCGNGAYNFIYLGPEGTCTQLHADVLLSYSWSTNLCGLKRWYLIPPFCTFLLYDVFGNQLASHLQHHSNPLHPGLQYAQKYAIEVIQYPGETIYVPSGWYHTVENLKNTFSINHNWLNGVNLYQYSWKRLQTEIETYHKKIVSNKSSSISDNNSNNNNAEKGQLEDDLLLIWMIVLKKAHSILDNTEKYYGPNNNNNSDNKNLNHQEQEYKSFSENPQTKIFNMRQIMGILEGIETLMMNKMDFDLMKKSGRDVQDFKNLLIRVREYCMEKTENIL